MLSGLDKEHDGSELTGQCSGALSGTVVGSISLDTGNGTGDGIGSGGCVAIMVLDCSSGGCS